MAILSPEFDQTCTKMAQKSMNDKQTDDARKDKFGDSGREEQWYDSAQYYTHVHLVTLCSTNLLAHPHSDDDVSKKAFETKTCEKAGLIVVRYFERTRFLPQNILVCDHIVPAFFEKVFFCLRVSDRLCNFGSSFPL